MSLNHIRGWTIRLLLLSVLLGTVEAAPVINTLKRGLLSESPTGTAINGYDAVAYFTQGKAVVGIDAYTFNWNGARWRFASQADLELFKADPARYGPQFGGYCAYGVSQGYLVSVEPEQFTILDGKLYLNYNADVQKEWTKDISGYNAKADAQFSGLLKK